MTLLFLIGYPVLMAAVALLMRKAQPGWRTIRIVKLTNLPLPICALVAAGIGVASVGPAAPAAPAAPGETDASGMAVVAFVIIGMFAAFGMLVLGIPASWAALHWTRDKG